MSTIAIDKLNVLTIYTHDLPKSLQFYCELLGFEKLRDMEPGVLLYSPGANLTVYLEGGRERREPAGMCFPTLSVCFNAREGVKKALETLEEQGVSIVAKYGDFEGPFAGFHFEDPSGNILEFAGAP